MQQERRGHGQRRAVHDRLPQHLLLDPTGARTPNHFGVLGQQPRLMFARKEQRRRSKQVETSIHHAPRELAFIVFCECTDKLNSTMRVRFQCIRSGVIFIGVLHSPAVLKCPSSGCSVKCNSNTAVAGYHVVTGYFVSAQRDFSPTILSPQAMVICDRL